MNFPLYIAKRYLLSKKSHKVINIISGVAIAGVSLATLAMVCTMSVFNGFRKLAADRFTLFDPELKISAVYGKSFDTDNDKIRRVTSLPEIEVATMCIEDKAMIQYGGHRIMVTLKGVEDNFNELTDIENAMIGSCDFILHDEYAHYAIPGGELISALNCGINYTEPLEVYAPKRGKKVSITNPGSNFRKDYLYSSGAIFIVNQTKYDSNYILTSLDFARKIFERKSNEATTLELKIAEGANIEKVKKSIRNILGNEFKVLNRYEQQKDIFKIMEIEKLISYIFLSFILLIACFNIIGSLSMLILDKKQDMNTLRSLGADNRLITNIFVTEGVLISIIGALSGIILGVIACLLQEHYGILSLGNSNNFIINSYPVLVDSKDIIVIFATVFVVGLAAVGIPVRLLTKRMFNNNFK